VTETSLDGLELSPDVPEGLPGSARTVYELLALEGPLTHREIVELSDLPPRTVRFAVSRLQDEDHVGTRLNLADSRQRFFFLTDEETDHSRRAL
jgi:DNA-binding MarR family transcriptional regulator